MKWKTLFVAAPSKQTVTGPVTPVIWMSTILVVPVIANGVAEASAGFSIGATVADAEAPAAAKLRLTLGNSAVAGIAAAVTPTGMVATREVGVEPTETET